MAVYTSLTLEEAKRQVSAQYSISELKEIIGISEGVTNTNYLFRTSDTQYIFTLFEGDMSEGDLIYFLSVMKAAVKKGINCPLPIEKKDGSYITHFNGKMGVLTSFLEGKSPRKLSVQHCAELGKNMAQLHEVLSSLSCARFNADTFNHVWKGRFLAIEKDVDKVKRGLCDEIYGHYDFICSQWPKSLPSGVIHGDLFPDNVFFSKQNNGDQLLTGIIDFYYACNDYWAYDVAICLNSWCFDNGDEYNVTRGRALLSSYNKVREMTEEERVALPVLCTGAALRFLITRLYDWINHDENALVTPKDPLEKLRILRFHRHVKNIREYGLD